MEGEMIEDPVAQSILKVGPEQLRDVTTFLAENGVLGLEPLAGAYGTGAVVLDAGDRVVRLSRSAPPLRPNTPFVLQPSVVTTVGEISVEIMLKLETGSISDADVVSVQRELGKLGYIWDDAGADNLGRDSDGKLWVIDGSVTKRG